MCLGHYIEMQRMMISTPGSPPDGVEEIRPWRTPTRVALQHDVVQDDSPPRTATFTFDGHRRVIDATRRLHEEMHAEHDHVMQLRSERDGLLTDVSQLRAERGHLSVQPLPHGHPPPPPQP